MYSCYSCSAMYSTLVSNAQNPPKISSLKNVFTTFYSKFKKIYIMRIVLKFKMCYIVISISMTGQFHEFLKLIFGGFFAIWSQ